MSEIASSPDLPPRRPRKLRWVAWSGFVVLAMVLAASLYTDPYTVAHAEPPSHNPCLSATVKNESNSNTIDMNHQARLTVYVFNGCMGTVTRLVASVSALMFTCSGIGTGTTAADFQFADAGTHEIRRSSDILSGGCVHCTDGIVDGYPPFDISVSLDTVAGQDSQGNPISNGDTPTHLDIHFANGGPGPVDPPCIYSN